tara:strand:+ start:452 stop:820 length:369 start_codon:yes stop_codon:yes gene_type:complete
MDYYEILDAYRDEDIGNIKKKFKKKILECHPDKNVIGDDKKSREIIEAWMYIKNSHNDSLIKKNNFTNNPPIIHDTIPKLGEFIRKEIERENKLKLEEKDLFKLEDEPSNSIIDSIIDFLFN